MEKSKTIKQITIEDRMVHLVDVMKKERIVKSYKEFCENTGLSTSNFPKYKYHTMKLTPEHIASICSVYNVNANWLLGVVKKPIFRDIKDSKQIFQSSKKSDIF